MSALPPAIPPWGPEQAAVAQQQPFNGHHSGNFMHRTMEHRTHNAFSEENTCSSGISVQIDA